MGKAAKSPWIVLVGAVASVVAVVTTFTGPVMVIGAPTSSKPDALSLEWVPGQGIGLYYVPLDAPLAEMPSTDGCGVGTRDWLAQHSVHRPASYLMSLRNNADSGPMLTVDNVRAVDKTVTEAPPPGFFFECQAQGVGETAVLDLDLDRDGQAMVDDEDGTDRPFAFNLEPGEAGSIELRLHAASAGYSGRVVADVTAGGTTTQVKLALGENGGDFDVPGAGKSAGFMVLPGNYDSDFHCVWPGDDGGTRCDLEDIQATVTEMWNR